MRLALRVEPACSWCNACARCATIPRMENEQNTQPAAAPAETPMPALDIVLASASPRRKQLLEDAGVRFVVHASEVDETLEPDLLADPPRRARSWPSAKPGAVVQEVLAEDYTGMAAVIGADTMVVCEGEIFGKPVSLSDAKRMLRCLSGRTHEVLTAVSVWMVAAPSPRTSRWASARSSIARL